MESENNKGKEMKFIGAKSAILITLVILSLFLLFAGTAVADDNDGHMGGDNMMDWDFFGIPMMWFWMGALWLVLLVIAFLVYKDAEKRGMNGLLWLALIILPGVGALFLIIYLIIREDRISKKTPGKSAYAILNERYAKGEITREEYLKMKKDISG